MLENIKGKNKLSENSEISVILQKDPETLTQDEYNKMFLYLFENMSNNLKAKTDAIAIQNKRLEEQRQVNTAHEKAIIELQNAVIELRKQLDVVKGAESSLMSSGGIILG